MSYTLTTRERDELDDRVDEIVAALEKMPPKLVDAIGSTLALAGPEWSYLGGAITDPWRPLSRNPLLHIQLRLWVERAVYDGVADDLLRRLISARGAPWPAVRKALKAAVGSRAAGN